MFFCSFEYYKFIFRYLVSNSFHVECQWVRKQILLIVLNTLVYIDPLRPKKSLRIISVTILGPLGLLNASCLFFFCTAGLQQPPEITKNPLI